MDVVVKHKERPHSATALLLVLMKCVQCDTLFTGLLYDGPGGDKLAVLPSTYGGLTMLHTPAGVAYYLDQAQKSRLFLEAVPPCLDCWPLSKTWVEFSCHGLLG